MFKFTKNDLVDSSSIQVGYIYKFSGQIIYGLDEEQILKLKKIVSELTDDTDSELVVIDFTELDHWDSLGITLMVPKLLDINEMLAKKNRPLVPIIGKRNADIYRAAKDKYGDRVNQDSLPWLESTEHYLGQL